MSKLPYYILLTLSGILILVYVGFKIAYPGVDLDLVYTPIKNVLILSIPAYIMPLINPLSPPHKNHINVIAICAIVMIMIAYGTFSAYRNYPGVTETLKPDVRLISPSDLEVMFETDPQRDTRAFVDEVRNFIHDNSCHYDNENGCEGVVKEYDSALPIDKINSPATYYLALEAVLDVANGKRDKNTLYMDCGYRRSAMLELLKYAEIQARTVTIYTDYYDFISNHVFLETYNPQTGKWEIHDPDYNVYYIFEDQTQRASIVDVISNGKEVVPCTDQVCDWKETNLLPLWEAGYYKTAAIQWDDNAILVVTDDFDYSKEFQLGESKTTLPEFFQSFLPDYEYSIISLGALPE